MDTVDAQAGTRPAARPPWHGRRADRATMESGSLRTYHERRALICDLGVEECALHCPPSARQSVPPLTTTPTRRYFAATGHTLQGALLTFWQKHGGLAVLGAPISEVFRATNGDGGGRSYQMQYFQHIRLELHPESADPRYTVLFGRLGADFLQDRGWVTTR